MVAVHMRLQALAMMVWQFHLVLVSTAPMPPPRLSMLQSSQNRTRGPIQTLPKTQVGDEHKDSVDKLMKQAKKDTVRHDEKLENKIFRLKLQVKELSSDLEKEEKQEAMEEAKKNALEKLEIAEPEKGGKEEADEEAKEEIEEESGKASALMIFGSVMLSAYLFFLANHGDKQVALWFWHTAENIIVIFLAVLYFQAFDDLLEVNGFASHHKVWAGLLHILFVFAVFVGLVWTVKDRHRLLTAYTGIGAQYVMFAAVHFGISTQEAYFGMGPLMTFFSVILFFVFVAACSVGFFFLKSKLFNESAEEAARLHHQDFEDSVDEMEVLVGAGVLAVVWTMAIRYLIMGRPPSMESSTDHTMLQRGLFLTYALVMSAITAFLLPKLEDWLRDQAHAASHIQTRLMLLASPFLTMSVAWAYLLWAEFEFHEFQFLRNKALGCITFAVIATFLCFSLTLALAKYSKRKRHPDLDRTDNPKLRECAMIEEQIQLEREAELRKTVVTMLALIIGWAWAATMHVTLTDAIGRTQHPFFATAAIALGGAGLILPLYIYYLRPFVENLEHSIVESRL